MTITQPPKHAKRSVRQFLIVGHYGFGNVGDEAILVSILMHLHTVLPDVRPIVVSGDPDATARLHRVRSIHWTDIASITVEAEKCDAILLGGGGLFHDYWSFDPSSILTPDHSGIAYFSGFSLLGAALDVPVLIVGVGVGPLLTPLGKETTRLAFEDAAYISVRDSVSRKVLEEIGVDGTRIVVTADPAFALNYRNVLLEAATREFVESLPRPIIGVALRSWSVQGNDSEELVRSAAEALDCFVETHGGSVLFFSFQSSKIATDDDASFAESIRHAMRFAAASSVFSLTTDPIQIAAMIERLDLMLAMRLHSVIFALKGNTPFAAIVYDPKVRSVIDEVGCGNSAIDISSVSSGLLYERLAAAFQRKDIFNGTVEQRVAVLSSVAEKALMGTPAVVEGSPMSRSASTSIYKRMVGALSAASTRMMAAREETAQVVSRYDELQRTFDALTLELGTANSRAKALSEEVARLQEESAKTAPERGPSCRRDLEQQGQPWRFLKSSLWRLSLGWGRSRKSSKHR